MILVLFLVPHINPMSNDYKYRKNGSNLDSFQLQMTHIKYLL
jgi:hypothetical protein